MTLENAAIPGGADTAAPVSVRDDVLAAFKEVDTPVEVTTEPVAEPSETAEQKAERIRDEQGRFARADEAKKAEPVKADVKTDIKPEVKTDPKVEDVAPPVQWKGNAKIDFNRLPTSVKQAISEEYKQYSEASQKVEAIDRVLTPQRRQLLAQAYGNDMGGLDQILQTVEYSNRDPLGFVKWYAQQNRIDLSSLVSPAQQQQPAIDPQLQQLLSPILNKVTSLEQTFQQRQAYEQQQTQAQIQGELNAFLSDHQNFPYAQDVRRQMGVLIDAAAQQGQTLSLKDAYDQAVWANPTTRGQLLAQQAQQSTQQLQATAQQKRQLSASVAGAPGTAQPLNGITNPKATVRDDVMEAMRQASGHI
jgi:hypothetical protein